MAARIAPSSSSVCFALTARGGRNSGTPLAMASTPVSDVSPAANALSTRTIPTASIACDGTSECPGCGCPRPSGWISPVAMTARSPTMNTSVGSRKARADSARPRRFSAVITARMPRQRGTVAPPAAGKAEVNAPTPAAIDRATVSV